ncbi:MAG: 6-carboxytetrahydropterin synthase [Candidatus Rokubacteria bacterium]|nr:6-carboxytetrahydropterin synthase [Candidatus Rokubacteria bacterium]
MLTLTRVYHFSAGHRLENAALGPDENARLYGACARPHGHNYYLEVTVGGVPDRVTGMVMDVARLDEVVHRELLDQVDHRTLETVPALGGVITTGEGLARAFWRPLAAALPAGALRRVTVVETAKNRFNYEGDER